MFHGGYRYGSRTIRKLEVGEERKNEKKKERRAKEYISSYK